MNLFVVRKFHELKEAVIWKVDTCDLKTIGACCCSSKNSTSQTLADLVSEVKQVANCWWLSTS